MLSGGLNEIIHVESSEPYLTHTKSSSKNVTLPTKVRLVKAMVFPVIVYGCESWIIKESEHQRIDAFELWCWRRLFGEEFGEELENFSLEKFFGLQRDPVSQP